MTSCFYFASNGRYGDAIYNPESDPGFVFTDSDHILSHIQPEHTHIARLTLPFSETRGFDGKILWPTIVKMVSPFLYTTNCANLSHHQTIEEFLAARDPLSIVRENGLLLKFIDAQTPEICSAALEQNPVAIRFVRDVTDEQCMDAIRRSADVIGYLKAPTEEMCILALSHPNCDIDCMLDILFSYRKSLLTSRVCTALVKRDGLQLEELSMFQTDPNVCMAAVEQNGMALQFVKSQTPAICMCAVQMDGRALEFVEHQTPNLCIAAVKQTVDAVVFVKEKTPEILRHMIRPV